MLKTLLSPYAVGVASRIAAQLITFVSVMVASRYVGLSSFGSYVLAWTVSVIFTSLVYTGLYQSLLRSEEPDHDASSYFWLMGIVASVGTLVSLSCGLLAGGWNSEPGTAFLLLAPATLFAFPTAWNEAHLVAQKRVRAASLYSLASQLATLLATWIGLQHGYGIIALIGGNYVGAVMGLIVTFTLVRRVPKAELRRKALADSRKTVPNLWGTSLLAMFSNYGGDLILGAFLSPVAVGAYRGGSRITLAVNDFIVQPLTMLSWSRFTRLEKEQDLDGMRVAWIDNMSLAGALMWPMMVALALLADPLVRVVFDDAWLPAAVVVVILAASRCVRFFAVLLEPALICAGHKGRQLRIRLIGAIVFLVALLSFGRLSVELAAYSHLLASAVVAVLALIASFEALHIRARQAIPVFLPGACIAAACAALITLMAPARDAMSVGAGLFATIGALGVLWLAGMVLCLRSGWLRLPQP